MKDKMIKAAKRYGFFLLLILINIAVMILFPDIGQNSLLITRDNFLEMISVLPPIFVILGLLDVWVDREIFIKYTGKNSGFKGIAIAFLLGSAAAGPLYGAFPVAGMMLKKGSSLMNVFIMIGAWSTTKIPMLTFEAEYMGFPFMLIRLALSLIGIPLIAWMICINLRKEDQEKIYAIHRTEKDTKPPAAIAKL